MTQTKTRVTGSGFTSLNFMGQPIAFLDGFRDSGQPPIAPPQAVTPLGARHPIEIATVRVLDIGTLTVSIRELWNEPVWWQLQGLRNTNDLVDVYAAMAASPAEVVCQMIIKPPGSPVWRGKIYHGCVVTVIDDGEDVSIGSLTIPRNLQISYTHTTPLQQPAA